MKKANQFLALLVSFVIVYTIFPKVSASEPYLSYAYSISDEGTSDVASPQSYIPEKTLNCEDLGASLIQPEDLLFDKAGQLYICDAGANAVYVFSSDFRLVRTVSALSYQGQPDALSAPYGIFVTDEGILYIADSGNNRVVAVNQQNEIIQTIEKPDSDLIADDLTFVPQKVLVDSSDRIFVLSKNVNEGIMQFTKSGYFLGFFGSNTVSSSVITTFWKKFMTEEQTAKLEQYIPVEYTNISLDYKGFIYAVSSVSEAGDLVRRLNVSGGDVLVRNPIDGSACVKGDLIYPYAGVSGITGASTFVDVTSDELGNYYVLDDKRGRIFGYDDEGNMLCVFGSLGSGQVGSFASPTAITYHNQKIYALDRKNRNIIVFAPTEYTVTLFKAMQKYILQDYEGSLALWEKIIKLNNNCDLAYYKAGYCYYRLQNYEKAMEYFKLINAKSAYSDASVKYNRNYMNQNFSKVINIVIVSVAGLIILIVVLVFIKKRKGMGEKRK